jgi:predicted GNAT family N-acyltransferase
MEVASMRLMIGRMSDPRFAEALALRKRALADPLGLPLDAIRFDFEDASLHVWALRRGRLIGCVSFFPESPQRGRLYQMAVDESERSKGVGRALVEGLEQRLAQDGCECIYLHARIQVAGFYRKLGYEPAGEPFIEVGIQHLPMARDLTLCSTGRQPRPSETRFGWRMP